MTTSMSLGLLISIQQGTPQQDHRLWDADIFVTRTGSVAIETATSTFLRSFLLCQAVGLKVKDVVVLIDREQGGPARLAESGLQLHSAFTLTAILKVLVAHGLVSSQVEASVKGFLADNQTFQGSSSQTPTPPKKAQRCISSVFQIPNAWSPVSRCVKLLKEPLTIHCTKADGGGKYNEVVFRLK